MKGVEGPNNNQNKAGINEKRNNNHNKARNNQKETTFHLTSNIVKTIRIFPTMRSDTFFKHKTNISINLVVLIGSNFSTRETALGGLETALTINYYWLFVSSAKVKRLREVARSSFVCNADELQGVKL